MGNVLITGGSSGIGLETAKELYQNGHRIILTARNKERLLQAQQAIGDVECFTFDVTQYHGWQAAFAFVKQHFGKLDVLVNSAGGGVALKPLIEQTSEQIAYSIQLNLLSVIWGTQVFAPLLCDGNGGLVVNICSVCSKHSYRKHTVYCAAKYGVLGFSRAASLELLENHVRVSCVLPGAVNTHFQSSAGVPETDSDLTAHDVAKAVAYIIQQPPNVYVEELTVWPGGRYIAAL